MGWLRKEWNSDCVIGLPISNLLDDKVLDNKKKDVVPQAAEIEKVLCAKVIFILNVSMLVCESYFKHISEI